MRSAPLEVGPAFFHERGLTFNVIGAVEAVLDPLVALGEIAVGGILHQLADGSLGLTEGQRCVAADHGGVICDIFVELGHRHDPVYQPHRDRLIGKTRWAAAEANPKTDDIWKNHLEDLEARRAFENLLYVIADSDGTPTEICVSGKPVFNDHGNFEGYVGFGFKSDSDALSTEAR